MCDNMYGQLPRTTNIYSLICGVANAIITFLYFVADVVGREAVYGCQGKALPLVDCGEGALYDILSITVYTTGDAAKIQNANSTCITGVAECNRKILSKAISIYMS